MRRGRPSVWASWNRLPRSGFRAYRKADKPQVVQRNWPQGYAPDLNLVGTVAGAPAVSTVATLRNVDGKVLSGIVGFFLNGLITSHPELANNLPDREKDTFHLSDSVVG
ncbi:lipase family protein [Nocardia gamkensis]|uniref:lipase family protein n=1 Tax=Nocardia gamkensis TaxID=352869 RepID=UPI0036E73425